MKLKLIFNVFLLLLNMVMISMSSATFIITVVKEGVSKIELRKAIKELYN